MREYISREKLRDLMYTEAFERDTGLQRWDSGLWIRYKLFENCIDAIPAADVVEVVRCRDCRYRDPEDHKCDCGGKERQGCPLPVRENYFCAHGKRKDGGQDDV